MNGMRCSFAIPGVQTCHSRVLHRARCASGNPAFVAACFPLRPIFCGCPRFAVIPAKAGIQFCHYPGRQEPRSGACPPRPLTHTSLSPFRARASVRAAKKISVEARHPFVIPATPARTGTAVAPFRFRVWSSRSARSGFLVHETRRRTTTGNTPTSV